MYGTEPNCLARSRGYVRYQTFAIKQMGLFCNLECAASGPATDLQATTLNELNYNHHDRDDQQDMNESAHRI